jgi:hypothetical protein
MTDDSDELLPASRLKEELLAAGLPVKAVCFDGHGFHVTYTPAVTTEDLERARPHLAGAYERLKPE